MADIVRYVVLGLFAFVLAATLSVVRSYARILRQEKVPPGILVGILMFGMTHVVLFALLAGAYFEQIGEDTPLNYRTIGYALCALVTLVALFVIGRNQSKQA